jgi:hypothetical protein
MRFSELEKRIIRKRITDRMTFAMEYATNDFDWNKWPDGDKLERVDWSGTYIYDGFYCIQFRTKLEAKACDIYVNVNELEAEIKSIERNKKLKELLG